MIHLKTAQQHSLLFLVLSTCKCKCSMGGLLHLLVQVLTKYVIRTRKTTLLSSLPSSRKSLLLL